MLFREMISVYSENDIKNTQDVKKKLCNLEVCSVQLSREVLMDICLKTSDYWDMGNIRFITTEDDQYGRHACQHNFQLFFS